MQNVGRDEHEKVSIFPLSIFMHLSMSSQRVGGRTWGGDLIVVVGPGGGHFIDIVLPGKEIFESFFSLRPMGSIERFNSLLYQSN